MKNTILLMLIATLSWSCSHGVISNIPRVIGGEKVFTYQGRANFKHQLHEAENMMIKHCKEFNAGAPIIIDSSKEVIGYITNFDNYAGSIKSNKNQVIQFKCVKE